MMGGTYLTWFNDIESKHTTAGLCTFDELRMGLKVLQHLIKLIKNKIKKQKQFNNFYLILYYLLQLTSLDLIQKKY